LAVYPTEKVSFVRNERNRAVVLWFLIEYFVVESKTLGDSPQSKTGFPAENVSGSVIRVKYGFCLWVLIAIC